MLNKSCPLPAFELMLHFVILRELCICECFLQSCDYGLTYLALCHDCKVCSNVSLSARSYVSDTLPQGCITSDILFCCW